MASLPTASVHNTGLTKVQSGCYEGIPEDEKVTTADAVKDSRAVPRARKKLKAGEEQQIHFWLPAELLNVIDQFADQSGGLQRTAAIKVLITEALRARGFFIPPK